MKAKRIRVPSAPACREHAEKYADLAPEALADLWAEAETHNKDWRASGRFVFDPKTRAYYAIISESRPAPILMLARLAKESDGTLVLNLSSGPTLEAYRLEGEDEWRGSVEVQAA